MGVVKVAWPTFTAQRFASAVYAVTVSVRPSVTSRSQDGYIDHTNNAVG